VPPEPRVTCLSVVGCSGHPPLKKVLKHLAKDRYAASIHHPDGGRVKLAGHLAPSPENQALFDAEQIRAVVVYRDPRDNLLQLVRRSILDYTAEKFVAPNTHPTAVAYHRLVKQHVGRWTDQPVVEFFVDDIGALDLLRTIFQVSEWHRHPRVQGVRYEDLVDLWRTDTDAPRRAITTIAEFLGASITDAELDALVAHNDRWLVKKVENKPNYLEPWQDVFTDHDKATFKRHFGDVLVDLGYEADDTW
jgi:hypothetical protein